MTPDKQSNLVGPRIQANRADFSDDIAFDDHKIAFAVRHATGRTVLDIGCIQHDPENYKSRYWVHKALKSVASQLVGLDFYEAGIPYLRERGFDVVFGDAQDFDLGRQFEVIFAGDIIEHLENQDGFIECCKRHLAPGGRMLVTTPNPWFWRTMLKAAAMDEVRANPEHTCWFCPQTLRQLVARHGLAVTAVSHGSRNRFDRALPLPHRWKSSTFHAVIEAAPQA